MNDDDVKRMKKILTENDKPLTQRFICHDQWIYIEGGERIHIRRGRNEGPGKEANRRAAKELSILDRVVDRITRRMNLRNSEKN